MPVKLPSEIILDKSLGKKRAVFYCGLFFIKDANGEIAFSKSGLKKICGYSVNRRTNIGAEIEEHINALDGLYIEKINKDKYKAKLQMDKPKNFALVYYTEFKKITESVSSTKIASTLLLLSYIRLKMHKPKNGDKKPECYFGYISNIEKEIGLSQRNIWGILEILEALDIIHSGKMPRYRDRYNNWHTGVSYFVNKHKYRRCVEDGNYDWHEEVLKTEEYIRNTQATFLKSNKGKT